MDNSTQANSKDDDNCWARLKRATMRDKEKDGPDPNRLKKFWITSIILLILDGIVLYSIKCIHDAKITNAEKWGDRQWTHKTCHVVDRGYEWHTDCPGNDPGMNGMPPAKCKQQNSTCTAKADYDFNNPIKLSVEPPRVSCNTTYNVWALVKTGEDIPRCAYLYGARNTSVLRMSKQAKAAYDSLEGDIPCYTLETDNCVVAFKDPTILAEHFKRTLFWAYVIFGHTFCDAFIIILLGFICEVGCFKKEPKEDDPKTGAVQAREITNGDYIRIDCQ
jgi:hypothetical protein